MAIEMFLGPTQQTTMSFGMYTHGPYTQAVDVVRADTKEYSRTSVCLVLLEAPQAYLDNVAAQPEMTRLATAATIDNQMTVAQVNAAQALFESYGIPSGFVNVGDTRRQVLRALLGLFSFSQRLEARFGAGFWQRAQANGLTLDSPWSSFPQALKNELVSVRDELDLVITGTTGTTTLRELMRAITDGYESRPMFMAGISI